MALSSRKGFDLKVIHLVTSSTGGAALAAMRLNNALINVGVDSSIVSVSRRTGNQSSDISFQSISKISQLKSSGLTFAQSMLVQKSSDPVSAFSLDLLDWDAEEVIAADVLHLHAFYNLASIDNFLERHPDKVKVVTFHDERFYTGGCHQSHACERLKENCSNCPQIKFPFKGLAQSVRIRTNSLVQKHGELRFIGPSSWVLDRAKQAFPNHPLDKFFRVLNPFPQSLVHMSNNKTTSETVELGFIAQDLDNPIKNLKLLLNTFEILQAEFPNKYKLTLIGSSKNRFDKLKDIKQIVVNSSTELSRELARIDLLVVPSTHDNLPNVIGEALMNGVSVIGSNVGGIPEVLDQFNMPVIDPLSETQLRDKIAIFEFRPREDVIKQANATFSSVVIARQLVDIYQEALNQIEKATDPA